MSIDTLHHRRISVFSDLRMDRRIDFRFIDPRAMNFQSEFDVAMAIFVLQFAETAEDLQKVREAYTGLNLR